jgi:PEP-CTERM motif
VKTNFGFPFVIGLFLVWGAAVPAQAGWDIYSNLGPGDSYAGTAGGWTLGDPPDYVVTASAFTAGVSLDLSKIEVAAGLVLGPNGAPTGVNQLTISLDTDSAGSPGAVLESFTITGAMPILGTFSSGHLVTATSVLHPLLTAGTQYWVVLSVPDDGMSHAAWDLNSLGDTGPIVQENHGIEIFHATDASGAMRITGQAVPEPSSIVLVGISAVAGLGRRLRRRSIAKAV